MTKIIATIALIPLLFSCAPSIDHPQGTSKGYTSARLIQRDPTATTTNPNERQIHSMIQSSLSKEFASNGLRYGSPGADLTVAYLVLYQEPGITASFPEYFGYGRNEADISDFAHIKGVLENQRPDHFRQAGIVVDVIDSRTNKLVFRGFAKGDVVRSPSATSRRARIDTAIAEALTPFFK
jgi:hypothetical protein